MRTMPTGPEVVTLTVATPARIPAVLTEAIAALRQGARRVGVITRNGGESHLAFFVLAGARDFTVIEHYRRGLGKRPTAESAVRAGGSCLRGFFGG